MNETMPSKTRSMNGTAWIADPDDAYWADGEAARLEVQQTDDNEYRLGILLDKSETDDATFYMTEGEAVRLMMALGSVLSR